MRSQSAAIVSLSRSTTRGNGSVPVAQATRTVDTVKVAVLAALNVADELFTARQRQEKIEGPLRKRVEKCVALVEKALEHSN